MRRSHICPGRFGKTLNMSMTERQYFFCASEGSKRFQADTKAAVPGDRRTVLPVPVSSGSGRYVITSSRESGFGRYDVMLKPRNKPDDAVIIEFKVHDEEDGKTLKGKC